MTVLLTQSSGNVSVSYVYINGTAYAVNLVTPMPWTDIGYVGLRASPGNSFYVSYFGVSPSPYGGVEQFVNNVESTSWGELPYWQNGQLVINVSSVSVTVTNSQPIATPVPFDQFLNITESQIASALGSTIASQLWQQAMSDKFLNLLFQQNGQTLYAWVQNYTSSWVAVWVKLPNGIPASSSVTINIYFTDSIQYPYTGIAPQLTSIYGQYDNGEDVFIAYWNFAGTSVPSGIIVYKSDGSVTFDNGVTIKGGTSTTGGENGIATAESFSPPIIVEYYGTQSTSPSGDSWGWNMVGFSNYLSNSDAFPS
jgi:hypothetical protein